MTAKGHITLQKYCFYVSWQNLDLNFQPCRLQKANKIKRRSARINRRFGKIKRRLVLLKRRFILRDTLLYLFRERNACVFSAECVAKRVNQPTIV